MIACSTLKDDRGEQYGVGLIFDLPLFKTSHIQSCTMITAAHSILTSCCFTTSTSAKEKKYKRYYLSLCNTKLVCDLYQCLLLKFRSSCGVIIFEGSYIPSVQSLEILIEGLKRKSESPCLLLEIGLNSTKMNGQMAEKYKKKQCYKFHAHCPPTQKDEREGKWWGQQDRSKL